MRAAVRLAVIALAIAAPAAAGQSSPFGPLPEAAPTATPAPEPVDQPDDDDVGRATLYGIGGALLVAFAGLAVWITRDARRSLPADRREQLERARSGAGDRSHRHEREAKAKARAKGRAQRQARKAGRRTRR